MRETVTENPGGKKKSDLKYVYIIFLQGIYSSVLEMNLSNVFYSPQASQAVRVNSWAHKVLGALWVEGRIEL